MTKRRRIPVGEEWKEQAACRRAVDYYARTWGVERAQRYVWDLYFTPGDGLKPGRPPIGGRTTEDDLLFLPRLWCSTCPVQEECLAEALAIGDIHGFRAGHTPNEIRHMVRERRRARLARSG